MQRRILYAEYGGRRLACQVLGDEGAGRDIVFVPSFVSHQDLMLTSPPVVAWLEGLTRFARLITFDKAGTGLSDPVDRLPTLEDRAEEIEAVMDAAGCRSAVLFGLSEGGPMAITFAATRPDRVDALVLFGAWAAPGKDGIGEGFASGHLDDQAIRDAFATGLGDGYHATPEQIDRFLRFAAAVRERWGTGEALGLLVPSFGSQAQLGLLERSSASPAMAYVTMLAAARYDIRHLLSSLDVPTLVVHARDDLVPFANGRYLADTIPGARLLSVEGRDHAPWFAEPDRITTELERFLTGQRASTDARRRLAAVLFLDLVGSTNQAATMGDARWGALIERFETLCCEQVEQHGGQFVKATGDGFLATFGGPARALRCAQDVRAAVRTLGFDSRIGLHVGEVVERDGDVAGLAVNIAARICDKADADEILVSGTVRDLSVGSGQGFEDRGTHELKGVPGRWPLLALDTDPHPLEAKLASTPLASPREDMKLRDRIATTIARRAPGLVRALSLRPDTGTESE